MRLLQVENNAPERFRSHLSAESIISAAYEAEVRGALANRLLHL